jgi:hypothetical protein
VVTVKSPREQPSLTRLFHHPAKVRNVVRSGFAVKQKGIENLSRRIGMAPVPGMYLSADIAQLRAIKGNILAVPRMPQPLYIVIVSCA